MAEYTWCPGACDDSKVRIWGRREISYCCHPCWLQTAYMLGISKTEPEGDEHSLQCLSRQYARRWEECVEGREWVISGRPTGEQPIARSASVEPPPMRVTTRHAATPEEVQAWTQVLMTPDELDFPGDSSMVAIDGRTLAAPIESVRDARDRYYSGPMDFVVDTQAQWTLPSPPRYGYHVVDDFQPYTPFTDSGTCYTIPCPSLPDDDAVPPVR
jgi:hypothetical protein